MKKTTRWIKIFAALSIIVGIGNILTHLPYSPYANLEFLITGVVYVAIGTGLYKLKKWGLYGEIVLMLYGLSSSLYKFAILRNNYFTVPIGIGTYIVYAIFFFVWLIIFYKIFWRNKNLFT